MTTSHLKTGVEPTPETLFAAMGNVQYAGNISNIIRGITPFLSIGRQITSSMCRKCNYF